MCRAKAQPFLLKLLACVFMLSITLSCSTKAVDDTSIEAVVVASERALYEANLEEAIELVRVDQYENQKGFTEKHRIQLTVQGLRVKGFANTLYLKSTPVTENLDLLLPLIGASEALDNGSIKANFFLALASLFRSSGNRNMANDYEEQALAMFNDQKDFESVARLRAGMISRQHNSLLAEGRKEEIIALIPEYEEEIRFAEEHSKYALAYNTRHLAQIHRRQTLNYEESLKLFERSLELRQEIGFKPFIPASYSSIGDVYFAMGENTKAIDAYEIARELAIEIGFKRYEYYPLIQIGKINASIGNVSDAIELFEKALESATANEYKAGIEEARKLIKEYSN